MRRVATLAGLVLLALCVLGVSSAARPLWPGSLDPSFGSGGVVAHNDGSGVRAVAVQPDGRIVVLTGRRLYRLLPNGSPDPSFSNGGFPARWVYGSALALQPDGKIVVAGAPFASGYPEFAVARFNADGSPDTSFGTDGSTTTAAPAGFDFGASPIAIAIVPGGGIVEAGSAFGDPAGEGDSFVLVRYTPSGTLDANFGHGGVVKTFFSGIDELAGIAVLPSGEIVASGSGLGDGHGDDDSRIALARYRPDGSLDPRFGTGGRVTTDPLLGWEGGPPALQGGKIVVAGSVIARFTAGGRLDPTFGSSGFVSIVGHHGPIAVQADRKILVAGVHLVVRLMPNGRVDTSFGKRGYVSLGAQSYVSSLALQADGKILVGGGNHDSWTVARLIGGTVHCVVPRVSGETIAEATATLRKANCTRGTIAYYPSSAVAPGRVIYTLPARGTERPPGYAVEIVVGEGKSQ